MAEDVVLVYDIYIDDRLLRRCGGASGAGRHGHLISRGLRNIRRPYD